MEILFISSEIAPYSGQGPAADVVAALPKALRSLDHKVTVVSPLYGDIDPGRQSLARRLSKVELSIGGRALSCEVYDGRTSGGVELVFIGHEALLRTVEALAPGGTADEDAALRAGLFTRAAVELAAAREPAPEAIHAHDWVGALFALHARRAEALAQTPIVLTIHDPSEQGVFDSSQAAALGIDEASAGELARGGALRLLPAGLPHATHVTTSSSTGAAQMCTPEGGFGMHEPLSALGDRFVGVEDGVDSALWNPVTDPKIRSRFDAADLSGKVLCKADLQRQVHLPVRDDVPLLGMVATGGDAAGFDLFAKAAPELLRNDCQVVAVYDGDPEAPLRAVLEELSGRFEDRLQVRDDDGDLVHVMLGAADLVLVPARAEPSGFTHLWAHRYGALPIVRRMGALADTVVDCDSKLETGTGFVFDEPTAQELTAVTRRAFGAFHERELFEALRRRVMRLDHSWDRSARLYERLYRPPSAE